MNSITTLSCLILLFLLFLLFLLLLLLLFLLLPLTSYLSLLYCIVAVKGSKVKMNMHTILLEDLIRTTTIAIGIIIVGVLGRIHEDYVFPGKLSCLILICQTSVICPSTAVFCYEWVLNRWIYLRYIPNVQWNVVTIFIYLFFLHACVVPHCSRSVGLYRKYTLWLFNSEINNLRKYAWTSWNLNPGPLSRTTDLQELS